MKKFYSIKDIKAGVFGEPQAFGHDVEAMRAIANAANNNKTSLYTYPADFELWQVSTFEEQTGVMEPSLKFIQSVINLKGMVQNEEA